MNSILETIKKMLGLGEEDTSFDTDVIVHINSVFMSLHQLGVGPADPFSITDNTAEWADFLVDLANIEAVKSYIYLKVKTLFDPPSSSFVLESYNNMAREMEWRLGIQMEIAAYVPPEPEGEEDV